jgi:DNA-binding transcriptional MerR regulator
VNATWLSPRLVAEQSGVSTDTLRHYERLGLLPPTMRTRAGYRRYHPRTIERVRMIQRALAVGFSLKDLASALRQRHTSNPPCRRVRELVSQRLATLEQRLVDLTALRDEMRALLRDWDDRLAITPPGQRALLLDMLIDRSTSLDSSVRATLRLPRTAR